MRRSLTKFRREIADDGLLGDCLATGLALALNVEMPAIGTVH